MSDPIHSIQQAINFLPDAIFCIDLEGRICAWNQAIEQLTGIKALEILGKAEYEYSLPFYKTRRPLLADLILHPELKNQALYTDLLIDGEILATDLSKEIGLSIRSSSFWAQASPLYDSNGKLIGAIESISARNYRWITPHFNIESTQNYQKLLDSANDAILVADTETGTILCANQAATRLFERALDEIIGMRYADLYPAEEIELRRQTFAEQVRKGSGIVRNINIIRKDGQKRAVEISSSTLEIGGRQVAQGIFRDVTEQKEVEEALRESEHKYRTLFTGMSESFTLCEIICDERGNPCNYRILDLNRACERLTNRRREDLIGQDIKTIGPNVDEGWIQLCGKVALTGESVRTRRYSPLINREIESFIFSPQIGQFACVSIDLTRQMKTEARLKDSEENYRLIFDAANDAIFIHDIETGEPLDINHKVTEMYGYTKEEIRAIGMDFMCLDEPPYSEQDAIRWIKKAAEGEPQIFEWLSKDKRGRIFWVEIILRRTTIGGKDRVMAFVRDISERKRAEEAIRHLAYHDPLTGLPNRSLFEDRLHLALIQASRSEQMLAVMFLDLDRFKTINDTLGHAVGDQLLREVSQRLSSCLREGDTIARLGGDEFILLLPQIRLAEDAAWVAQRIFEVLKPPFEINGNQIYTTASIGIAIYPYDGKDGQALWMNADTAMYRAKEQGNGTCQFYTPSMNAKAIERFKLESSLRNALDNEEFLVYYQPQVDLSTGKPVGIEALIRWHQPNLGFILPGEFIPLAEQTGLIVPVGEWVLEQACIQGKMMQKMGLTPLRIAVNLSARQFQQDNLVEMTSRILAETEFDPHFLEFEITESAVMQDTERSIAVLKTLKEMGIHITIDDFGIGYSSLSYLKMFPIDTVKIDRSFIRDVTTVRNDAAIAAGIIAMAHSLGLKVVAEGVETLDQLAFIKQQNCDEMQGFLYSQAITSNELKKLLEKGISLRTGYSEADDSEDTWAAF